MKRQTFFAFAAPSITVMTLLMVIPLGMAIWLGMHFMTFDNILAPQFTGLDNYASVLSDARFWQSFQFTALYVVVMVPSWIILGFLMALVLDQVTGFIRGLYLSIYLLPFIIVPVVGAIMFKQLFEASGPMNYLYAEIFDARFRYNETTVKTLIMLYGVWYVTPFSLVVYFAGLQTLPGELLEAASIDGATSMQKIRHIVIPHVSSLTLFISLFSIMDAYRVFDQHSSYRSFR
ncbi:MAG: sugar ABC transporter permease, partial [Chloroflexota bacterium]